MMLGLISLPITLIKNLFLLGANIRSQGIQATQSSKNLKSAFQLLDFIQTSIDKLLTNSHAHGPFSSPPFNHFCCSPLKDITLPHHLPEESSGILRVPGIQKIKKFLVNFPNVIPGPFLIFLFFSRNGRNILGSCYY